MKISVSILSCKDKISGIKKINKTSADFLHIDFMDGKFTENKSLSIKEVKEINKILPIHKYIKNITITTKELSKTTTQKVKRFEELKKV